MSETGEATHIFRLSVKICVLSRSLRLRDLDSRLRYDVVELLVYSNSPPGGNPTPFLEQFFQERSSSALTLIRYFLLIVRLPTINTSTATNQSMLLNISLIGGSQNHLSSTHHPLHRPRLTAGCHSPHLPRPLASVHSPHRYRLRLVLLLLSFLLPLRSKPQTNPDHQTPPSL